MRTVISGIIGGAVFLIFLLAIRANFLIALIVGILGFVASFLIIPSNEEKEEQKAIAASLRDGYGKLSWIKAITFRLKDQLMKEELQKVVESAKWILDYLKRNPVDASVSRRFLDYYIDTTLNMVQKYESLEKGVEYTDRQEEKLNQAKKVVILIRQSFEKQISKIVDDDFTDLSVEVELLEKKLKREGLLDE